MCYHQGRVSLFLKIFIYLAASVLSHTGSVVEDCDLSCPVACGILVLHLEIEPASPASEGRFLTTGLPGKPKRRIS